LIIVWNLEFGIWDFQCGALATGITCYSFPRLIFDKQILAGECSDFPPQNEIYSIQGDRYTCLSLVLL
jgi:hypothetical protein